MILERGFRAAARHAPDYMLDGLLLELAPRFDPGLLEAAVRVELNAPHAVLSPFARLDHYARGGWLVPLHLLDEIATVHPLSEPELRELYETWVRTIAT